MRKHFYKGRHFHLQKKRHHRVQITGQRRDLNPLTIHDIPFHTNPIISLPHQCSHAKNRWIGRLGLELKFTPWDMIWLNKCRSKMPFLWVGVFVCIFAEFLLRSGGDKVKSLRKNHILKGINGFEKIPFPNSLFLLASLFGLLDGFTIRFLSRCLALRRIK